MLKREFINILFILTFPVYGIGCYVSAAVSPSVGYLVSATPPLLMIAFYMVDMLYKTDFVVRINGTFFLTLLYIASGIASMFVALSKGLPESNSTLMIFKSVLLVAPFLGFIIFMLYNLDQEDVVPRLLLWSLGVLLGINLVGFFALGLSNSTHAIDGRLNFPFLDGFYSGAAILAIINLILIHYMKKYWADPVRMVFLVLFFAANLVMLFMINSRLTILIFLFVAFLQLTALIRLRGLFVLSLFTIPILLASGLAIYQILQLPAMESILQRVDLEDVTTFNGRSFIWQDAIDWLFYDREGFWLGNGFKGHYFLGLIADVAEMWNEEDTHHMHLHSSSLEILVSQGIIFFVFYCVLLRKTYTYYRTLHAGRKEQGVFLPVMVFLFFILQVDTFVYLDNLGFLIFSMLIARVSIRGKTAETIRKFASPQDRKHEAADKVKYRLT